MGSAVPFSSDRGRIIRSRGVMNTPVDHNSKPSETDSKAAAVELIRCGSRERLLRARPEELSPAVQPDGTPSAAKVVEITEFVEKHGSHRFEWVARRFDGEEVPL